MGNWGSANSAPPEKGGEPPRESGWNRTEQNSHEEVPLGPKEPPVAAGVFKNPEFLRYSCALPMCGCSCLAERDVYLSFVFFVPSFAHRHRFDSCWNALPLCLGE